MPQSPRCSSEAILSRLMVDAGSAAACMLASRMQCGDGGVWPMSVATEGHIKLTVAPPLHTRWFSVTSYAPLVPLSLHTICPNCALSQHEACSIPTATDGGVHVPSSPPPFTPPCTPPFTPPSAAPAAPSRMVHTTPSATKSGSLQVGTHTACLDGLPEPWSVHTGAQPSHARTSGERSTTSTLDAAVEWPSISQSSPTSLAGA
mmetsp:Transcript_18934/g.40863  ORF Transcript_18934/g.40863 Transcript_18934/m.40863 type:complete len:204 (-) Transcript_18934:347-958(-)